ncbi:hypothetical protein MY1884_004444 [Beauveria asiatica]
MSASEQNVGTVFAMIVTAETRPSTPLKAPRLEAPRMEIANPKPFDRHDAAPSQSRRPPGTFEFRALWPTTSQQVAS